MLRSGGGDVDPVARCARPPHPPIAPAPRPPANFAKNKNRRRHAPLGFASRARENAASEHTRPEQIYQLPEQELIIRHICVEGWDYIGQWSGPNLRGFLTRIGADLTAKYVYFICNDDFTESIDMASALHPQTILATKYAGEPIADPFGYPLRLRTAVKLGYKNPKWIKAIEVTNTFRETFWSRQGENWFAGI